MLGNLPKLLDKNFVLGFYLPALLAVFVVAWAFPGLSILDPVRQLAASERKLDDLAYLGLLIWVAAILLMTGNHLLYRLLEGYVPPVSWFFLGSWWHRYRFGRLKKRLDRLMQAWQAAADGGEEFPGEDKASTKRRVLVTRYPSAAGEIMPTRFGNAIRSFEVYPRELYDVDSVPVWLRLASVIPRDYSGLLDDARAQADCFVNLTCLSLLIGLACLAGAAVGAAQRIPPWPGLTIAALAAALGPAGMHYVAFAAATLAFGVFTYSWAVNRVTAWGDLVRSAFDCYLPALINQLGYAIPATEAERRNFWNEFSALITYEQAMATEWPLAGGAPANGRPGKGQPQPHPATPEGKPATGDSAGGAAEVVAVAVSIDTSEGQPAAPDPTTASAAQPRLGLGQQPRHPLGP